LSNNWTIFIKFTLNVFVLDSNAEIVDLVNGVFKSAFVGFEVVDFTFSFFTNIFMAILSDKTFLFTPLKDFVNVTTITSLLVLVAIDDFLCRQLNCFISSLANLILDNSDGSESIR
jgi:hypothetical protein